MMTDEQRYLFDLQGYLVVPGVLTPAQVARFQADMKAHEIANPDNDPNKSRFGGFLEWGTHWAELIDHAAIMPLLAEMLGPKFRLDHAYGMAMSAKGVRGGEGLHHQAGMFNHGCFYVTHGNTAHNGLVVVSFALSDMPPGGGGFCCIPGSHKALYPAPREWFGVNNNPVVVQPSIRAGDVLIFTEALTHGTMPWTEERWERRSVLLKYCPHYMQWAKGAMNSNVADLTPRQKAILEGAYVWERKPLELQPS